MIPPRPSPDGQGRPAAGAVERRHARTGDPLVALARCFEAARRRAGLSSLVLADESGLAIAGAGPSDSCDELAARAAVTWAGRAANDTVPCRLDVILRTMEVRRLRIDGIEVLLCAEGMSPAADAHLDAAAVGCERILSRRKAPPSGA